MMAVVLSNQIAGFVAVPSEKKNIFMLFAGREVRIGKNCARAVLKNKGTAQMLEKKIYLFQSTKFFKLLKQLFPVRLGK